MLSGVGSSSMLPKTAKGLGESGMAGRECREACTAHGGSGTATKSSASAAKPTGDDLLSWGTSTDMGAGWPTSGAGAGLAGAACGVTGRGMEGAGGSEGLVWGLVQVGAAAHETPGGQGMADVKDALGWVVASAARRRGWRGSL